MNKMGSKQHGFTFMEVTSVLLISSVLAAMGVPMVEQYSQNAAGSVVQAAFSEALTDARTNAVSLGKNVAVCASQDGRRCTDDASSIGWLAYVKEAGAKDGEAISEHHIVGSFVDEEIRLELKLFNENLQAVNEIIFDSRGFNLAEQRIAATLCLVDSSEPMETLVVERSGRIRTSNKPVEVAAALSQNTDSAAGTSHTLCI